jgi:excisionase family DNA binding protein
VVTQELYSVEQVAERLGLHVRTVRNYVRDGRLKAVRIGKQYRIAREDLEKLTGRPVPARPRESAGRRRRVEVSSIVQADAITPELASRAANTLLAAIAGPRDDQARLHVETVYDEERAHLKIVVLGPLAASAEILRLIGPLIGEEI